MGEISINTVVLIVLIVLVVAALGLTAVLSHMIGHKKGQEFAKQEIEQELDEIRASEANARGQIEALTAQNSTLATEKASADVRADELNRQIAFFQQELNKAQQAEQLRIEREQLRAQEAQDAKAAEHAQRLQEHAKVMESIAPVNEGLKALQAKVAQIEEGRKQEMGTLGEQLRGLNEQQLRLDKQTSTLSQALINNKTRGAWGEAQLRNIVESAGLIEHVDFDTQVVVKDADGKTQRPDMIVHLPGGKTIPIDAKVPYADYQRACEISELASDDDLARRDDHLKAHAQAMRNHVNTLADKAYWEAFDASPDFVVAFIPNEALLQAALETDPALMDDAFAKKVALTSPVTLWAVLKSVAFAWQQQVLTEDAKTMFSLFKELYGRFEKLGERSATLGKSIAKTVSDYNEYVGTLEGRVLPTVRKLNKVDPSTVIAEISMLDSDKVNVRELASPELHSDNDESSHDGASEQ